MSEKLILAALAASVAAACVEPGGSSTELGSYQSELSLVPRAGATCAALGHGNQQVTLRGPVGAGSYALDAQNSLRLTYYDDTDTIFYFHQSTLRITAVLASIGDRTLVWDIPGGADAWPSLHGPPDPATGDIVPADEVAFCFDYELRVQPSPYAHHAQMPTWTITKSGRAEPVTLAEGQSELVEYAITVRPGTVAGAGQFIQGPVFVWNKSPHTVTVPTVTTMVGEIAAEIECPTAFPLTLAPFSLVECEFHADVPDTADRTVVGGAVATHGLKLSTQEVVASFAAHNVSTTVIDDCVAVYDDAVPYTDHYLGTVCTADGEQTFEFSYELGPFACGDFAVTNTARFVGLDTGDSADASWTVNGEVACTPGCTLSAWYWKLHSNYGPRRYNPTWAQVGAQGENTTFFRSGGSWVHAMYRLSLLNPYWITARAYVAARLNQLNGAQFTPAVQAAFTSATSLFTSYTPTQALLSSSVRRQLVNAAATLYAFNNGRVGPGRCTCRPDLDPDE